MTPKERNLLKGAIRRVFSRSDLRKQVVEATIVKDHSDPNRPRVKKWSRCKACTNLVPTYTLQVDHIVPIVPLDSSLEEMEWDEVISRTWCDIDNLQAICEDCHKNKTKEERKQRTFWRHKSKRLLEDLKRDSDNRLKEKLSKNEKTKKRIRR